MSNSPFFAKDLFRDMAANLVDLKAIRNGLEGPKPLRTVSFIVGLCLLVFSVLGMFNIFLLGSPAYYVLQAYEGMFGFAIVVVELKDQKVFDKYKTFIYKWFPFTTVMAGKGLLLIIAGMLGLGFGMGNLLLAIPGACAFLIGIVYVLMHFGKAKRMNEMYDVSMFEFTSYNR